jgi:hypothetical protein
MRRKFPFLIFTVFFLLNGCLTKEHNHDISGSWKIGFYWDEKEETSNFSEYYFMFNSGGKLMAHKGMSTYTGTWSETSTTFTIDFGNDPVLSELNDEWVKIEESNTLLKLKDDNPAQDDEVHFVKN